VLYENDLTHIFWSEYPNINDEIHTLLDDCEWYQVYDVIEEIYNDASKNRYRGEPERFEEKINSYFRSEGIGWQLMEGRVEVRGSEISGSFFLFS
jgi:hypothetical protein